MAGLSDGGARGDGQPIAASDLATHPAMPPEAPLTMAARPLELWTLSAAAAALGRRLWPRRLGAAPGRSPAGTR